MRGSRGAEGFIEEEDLGVYGEGSGQPDALLHASTQFVGVAFFPSHHPTSSMTSAARLLR